MFTLSNGHRIEYVVASGALAFGVKGWMWEWPLRWVGLIKPELFTVFIKSLTRNPRKGNLRWWKPWECVRLIPGGSVNKVGLTNPGIDWWVREVAPRLDYKKFSIAGSIFGNRKELVEMARKHDGFDIVALEVNYSCPNSDHPLQMVKDIIDSVKDVRDNSRHPIIAKVSVDQDYLAIAQGLRGVAQAISLNSVKWETVFPGVPSPLKRLEDRVGGGGGGVSGKPAQKYNWPAVKALATQVPEVPVIAPSIMEYSDLKVVRDLGAKAVSFGAIHLRTPWKPTDIVLTDLAVRSYKKEVETEKGSE